jgi:hypothetical protein
LDGKPNSATLAQSAGSEYFCRVASIASRSANSVAAPAFSQRMNSSIRSLVALSSMFQRLMTICGAPT